MNIVKLKPDDQDRNSEAWKMLCEYVDICAREHRTEFAPREYLGDEHFQRIYTLPTTIGTLTSVKKMRLYGSKLKRIPPEIGMMAALEDFDPYTSRDLHWFPYEITRCKHLKKTRVSIRKLYGNFKNKKPFPDLNDFHIRYDGDHMKCSVCDKTMHDNQANQVWITLQIGHDDAPLLASLCSNECAQQLPTPPPGYIPHAHKGGNTVVFPKHGPLYYMGK
ncbi:MAG: hypothetical protein J7623_28835 [Chitinophaga sp.]|uniref:hypothetical protein n=1 Tax=Chitinophaga sp. TaxID=1869181 RepID=UPI001B21624D|nr:hypothetical protein [Chitinophaga sp.]MBO9732684.1 hypothetical protein [Chitinophaga sp.]